MGQRIDTCKSSDNVWCNITYNTLYVETYVYTRRGILFIDLRLKDPD